jgi:hypothetical protein
MTITDKQLDEITQGYEARMKAEAELNRAMLKYNLTERELLLAIFQSSYWQNPLRLID